MQLRGLDFGFREIAEDPRTDQAANGSVEVTAIADTGKLNPEIWGTATSCLARFPPAGSTGTVASATSTVVNATLNGTLIFYSLGPLPSDPSDMIS